MLLYIQILEEDLLEIFNYYKYDIIFQYDNDPKYKVCTV